VRKAASVVISSDQLAVTSHPEHGFHVSSVVDRSDGVELLWRRRTASPRVLGDDLGPPGAPSVDMFDEDLLLGGWFLMFPSVGVPGPDDVDHWMHGEAPRLAWTQLEHTRSHVRCSVQTPSGFEVVRTLGVLGSTFTIGTSITNRTAGPLTWAMGEHPCFSREAFAGGAVTSGRESTARRMEIPLAADGRQRHTVLPTGTGSIRLALPTRDAQLHVDPAFYPALLVWEDYAADEGKDVIAIEPATVPGRTTTEHTQAAAWRQLDPGHTARTTVHLTLL